MAYYFFYSPILASLVASISHLLSHHYSRAKGRVFEDFATCKEGNSLGEVSKAAKENEVFFILVSDAILPPNDIG